MPSGDGLSPRELCSSARQSRSTGTDNAGSEAGGVFAALIWTLVMPTYCVTERGIQLPWFNLSVRGPSASPPNCSIKRVSEDAPPAPDCRLRAAGAQRARRGCRYAVCLPAAVLPRPHPAGSLQRRHPLPRGEQRGEHTSLHFSTLC